MCFSIVGLYTVMNLKKPFNFIKNLPNKLNRHYNKISKNNLIIKNKSKRKKIFNPVTNFDKSFERYIRSLITKVFPKDAILGEEFKYKNSQNEYEWSVDPIDGTKLFVIGVPTWSNLVGLMYKKKSIIGLANFPGLNRYYLNDKLKTYLYKDKKKYILKSSFNHKLKDLKIIGNFHGQINDKIKNLIINRLRGSFKPISFDALNYCLLAEGKVDAVIETNLKPYDIIPMVPIVKNAGGWISNWKNDNAEFGGNILATSNKKLHEKILKILKPFIKNL